MTNSLFEKLRNAVFNTEMEKKLFWAEQNVLLAINLKIDLLNCLRG